MTGDDIFELAERLDRIAVAVERIATALEPVTTTAVEPTGYATAALAAEAVRCRMGAGDPDLRCVRPAGHDQKHLDQYGNPW